MSRGELKAACIIPARYASTRFPGKALALIAGKPMIQRVYEGCAACPDIAATYVATDDERIAETARTFTDNVVMTSSEHRSGTDRVAEAARDIEADVIVNVQGDEPLIQPEALSALISPFRDNPDIPMTTLGTTTDDREEVESPNTCKIVLDNEANGLYFSRAPIPYYMKGKGGYLRHIGLYAFRRDFLFTFAGLPPGPFEKVESLEMLRAIEHGFKIRVIVGGFNSIGVDTPEDVEKIEELLAE
jgi:3-deoxy-manno-octulosonate cytidylyltransferase (CMP-KDO synthetase)